MKSADQNSTKKSARKKNKRGDKRKSKEHEREDGTFQNLLLQKTFTKRDAQMVPFLSRREKKWGTGRGGNFELVILTRVPKVHPREKFRFLPFFLFFIAINLIKH